MTHLYPRDVRLPVIHRISAALLGLLIVTAAPARAGTNVITDWDEKSVAFVTTYIPGPMGSRAIAIVHLAMFDAVNSIEPRYRPYVGQVSAAPGTSKEAAAAAAAGAVLAALVSNNDKAQTQIRDTAAAYLSTLPDGDAKSNGIKLGEGIAAKILDARANDRAGVADDYRPITKPGVYVPTQLTVGSKWPDMTPFVIAKPSQFRPEPPVSLKSKEWAADYNELKDYGGKTSSKRSPEQTETARFWLVVGPPAYQPFARQLVMKKDMSVVDSARLMALVSVALSDALAAVFDAKYHYNFWRPVTAIRNGDTDDNPATERMATWEPIDNTPLHPEYPCAHCISSGAVETVIEAALGGAEIPEIALTSPTAPGVTHRWTNLKAFSEEVANARIWAGFHYRTSTRVGQEMGHKIGKYVADHVMQPLTVAGGR
jgi:hypothetical protein